MDVEKPTEIQYEPTVMWMSEVTNMKHCIEISFEGKSIVVWMQLLTASVSTSLIVSSVTMQSIVTKY